MSDQGIKLCKDCKYHVKDSIFDHCHHQNNMTVDFVNGGDRPRQTLNFCRERSDYCGILAAWFEPKEE